MQVQVTANSSSRLPASSARFRPLPAWMWGQDYACASENKRADARHPAHGLV